MAEAGIPVLHGGDTIGGAEWRQPVSERRQIRRFAVAAGLHVIDKARHEPLVVRLGIALIAVVAVLGPVFFGLMTGNFYELGFVEVAYRRLNNVSNALADKRIGSRRSGAETSGCECNEEANHRNANESHGSFAAENEYRARRGVMVTPREISAVNGEEVEGYAGGMGLSTLDHIGKLKFSSRKTFGRRAGGKIDTRNWLCSEYS
jgi:hypothetical protein